MCSLSGLLQALHGAPHLALLCLLHCFFFWWQLGCSVSSSMQSQDGQGPGRKGRSHSSSRCPQTGVRLSVNMSDSLGET